MLTRADHVVNGLTVQRAAGVVSVHDGADRWLCRGEAWDLALAALDCEPPIVGETDHEAECAAYEQMCRSVASPVASVIGTSRGAYEQLVCDAVAAELLDGASARSAYGVEVWTETMASYRIVSAAGVDMGIYAGATPEDALDAMARDAGHASQQEAIDDGIAPFRGTVTERVQS